MNNEAFYFKHSEPNRSCFLAMRDILLAFNEEITETTKYGMPCFCYKGKMFCYLWQDKKMNAPYFLFVDGNKMTHKKLLSGDRKRMKTYPISPEKDLPIKVIHEILHEALSLR